MKTTTTIRLAAIGWVLLSLVAGCASLVFTPYDTTGAAIELPVALVSPQTGLAPEENRAAMAAYIRLIMEEHGDVRLINFGESSLGWYIKNGDPDGYQTTVAEPIDGTTVTMMRELAAELGVYLSFGFAESDGDSLYSSGVIIDDTGEIIAHRRKSNLVIFDKLNGVAPGPQEVTYATVDGIKVAFLICADFRDTSYQETVVADEETKVLILPHASSGLKHDFVRTQPQPYPGKWFLSAQRYSTEGGSVYYGSSIIDPNGYMVLDTEEPGYLYYTLAIK